jgi:hypothetical protein
MNAEYKYPIVYLILNDTICFEQVNRYEGAGMNLFLDDLIDRLPHTKENFSCCFSQLVGAANHFNAYFYRTVHKNTFDTSFACIMYNRCAKRNSKVLLPNKAKSPYWRLRLSRRKQFVLLPGLRLALNN